MRALPAAAHIRALAQRAATVVVVAVVGIAGMADTHTVQPGETLSEIAQWHNTSVQALVDANGVSNPNRIFSGQVLAIPTGGRGGGAPPAATSYVVVAGDSLERIARRHGVSVASIVGANGLLNPNLIRTGQALSIPVGAIPAGATGPPAPPAGADGRTGVAGSHLVVSGESLAGIARRYGISMDDLAAANGIVAPYVIFTGSQLRLDAGNALPGSIATCPVPGAGFANDWGLPRSGGRSHEGNDLFAPRGSQVLAPVGGTVTVATGAIGGHQFRLHGDDGTLYLGSHLDGFGATGRVAAGTIIGYVGDSGNARGGRPHLHFEIHPGGGAAMNPYPVLRAAC